MDKGHEYDKLSRFQEDVQANRDQLAMDAVERAKVAAGEAKCPHCGSILGAIGGKVGGFGACTTPGCPKYSPMARRIDIHKEFELLNMMALLKAAELQFSPHPATGKVLVEADVTKDGQTYKSHRWHNPEQIPPNGRIVGYPKNPKFERRHYEDIAGMLHKHQAPPEHVEEWVNRFTRDNPLFDESKFRQAVAKGGTIGKESATPKYSKGIYQEIANALAKRNAQQEEVDDWAALFGADNPRFDRDKFHTAIAREIVRQDDEKKETEHAAKYGLPSGDVSKKEQKHYEKYGLPSGTEYPFVPKEKAEFEKVEELTKAFSDEWEVLHVKPVREDEAAKGVKPIFQLRHKGNGNTYGIDADNPVDAASRIKFAYREDFTKSESLEKAVVLHELKKAVGYGTCKTCWGEGRGLNEKGECAECASQVRCPDCGSDKLSLNPAEGGDYVCQGCGKWFNKKEINKAAGIDTRPLPAKVADRVEETHLKVKDDDKKVKVKDEQIDPLLDPDLIEKKSVDLAKDSAYHESTLPDEPHVPHVVSRPIVGIDVDTPEQAEELYQKRLKYAQDVKKQVVLAELEKQQAIEKQARVIGPYAQCQCSIKACGHEKGSCGKPAVGNVGPWSMCQDCLNKWAEIHKESEHKDLPLADTTRWRWR